MPLRRPLVCPRRSFRIGIVIALVTALPPGTGAADVPATGPGGFVVRDVRVFDGERTFARTDVVVRDGRIDAIGRGAQGGVLLFTPGAAPFEPVSLADRVLRYAGEGRSASEIAKSLGLTTGTVRNYLSEAIGKLGASNRIDAYRIARQKGWL